MAIFHWGLRLFSDVWSEKFVLFEGLMEIHSNPPMIYYGFKTFRLWCKFTAFSKYWYSWCKRAPQGCCYWDMWGAKLNLYVRVCIRQVYIMFSVFDCHASLCKKRVTPPPHFHITRDTYARSPSQCTPYLGKKIYPPFSRFSREISPRLRPKYNPFLEKMGMRMRTPHAFEWGVGGGGRGSNTRNLLYVH